MRLEERLMMAFVLINVMGVICYAFLRKLSVNADAMVQPAIATIASHFWIAVLFANVLLVIKYLVKKAFSRR